MLFHLSLDCGAFTKPNLILRKGYAQLDLTKGTTKYFHSPLTSSEEDISPPLDVIYTSVLRHYYTTTLSAFTSSEAYNTVLASSIKGITISKCINTDREYPNM